MESKYSRGKIYLIRNKNNEELIYVGSTIEPYLSKRFNKHKYQNNCSLYNFINNPNNNTNWDDWYIELYEEYPCQNKLQLCKKENEIIREKATINKIGFRTDEMKKEQDKKYRDIHKEEIKQRNIKYVENNREKLLAKKAEYNEAHKEYKNNYMKERYILKREKILDYEKERREKSEKISCDCGSCIFKYKLSDHLKTKKHIDYIALL
jgi:hypothetical protein